MDVSQLNFITMEIKSVFPSEMQKPKGHYSPAIVHNGIVYVEWRSAAGDH